MKKWLIVVSVLVVLLGGGAGYWYSQQKPSIVSEPIDALPTSAVLVVSYPDLNAAWETFETLEYHDLLLSIPDFDKFFSRNSLIDSTIRSDAKLRQAIGNSTIWSSYHVGDSDSLLVFHAIKIGGGSSSQILDQLRAAFSVAGIVSDIQFGEENGFKLVVEEPFYTIYGTVSNGLVLLSTNERLLTLSLSQLKSGRSLKQIPSFSKAIGVAGQNVEANIFINYAAIPAYLKRALKPTMLYHQELIADFASWTELDLILKPNGFTFNGFTFTTDSLNEFLGLFMKQKPRPIEFADRLPANTASFIFFGISDLITFSADYRKFLESQRKLTALELALDTINEKYSIDLEQNMLAWMGGQHGLCITEPENTTFADETYWVFEARSPELAKRLLGDLSSILSEKNGTEKFSETVNDIEIGRLSFGSDLNELFGEGYADFGNPYYMGVNGYVIFGKSLEAMKEYLRYLLADRTLAKELSFSRFADNLGSTYNIFSYHHLNRSEHIFQSYLNRKAVDAMNENRKAVASFQALGTQITSTGQSFYSNIFLRYDPDWKETDESFWKAQLDAEPISTPAIVKNHVSGELEVLVQDKNNLLYLFNLAGQELFRRELPEPIESKITQVDRYKNGNLQYMFNTKNYVYQLDRNGKDVEGFPIELNSPAETDLSVIEYDNKRDYRLLISCKNKHIYNYEIDGTKVKGWNHNQASDPTIHPFSHIAVKGKDYLITGESNGKIHLLDRRGKNRVKVDKYVPASKNNHLQTFTSSEAALAGIYITDENGLINRIALNGDVQTMDLGKFSPEHRFFVADLNNDGGPEFIFHDLNMLTVFNYKKEKIFEQRTDPSATPPQLMELGEGKAGIGFCYVDSEQLFVFGPDGSVVKGFPLSGRSQFALRQLENSTIVVSAGTDNTVTIQTIK